MKTLLTVIFGLSLTLKSFGGATNDSGSAANLETRAFRISNTVAFYAHLDHFVKPREGEDHYTLLKRFFTQQKATYQTFALNEGRPIIFIRATHSEIDKIEELVIRIQDDIPLSVPVHAK